MSFYFTNKTVLNKELLQRLGCSGCPLASLDCNRQDGELIKIGPSGSENPQVYYMGIGPGKEEMAYNPPSFLVGPSGKLLKSCLTAEQAQQSRWSNITFHHDPTNNPPPEAIEPCRKFVEEDILRTRPPAIVALGGLAVNWFLNSNISINDWRGHRFPAKIGDHSLWVLPVWHPAYALRYPNLEHVFRFDIKNAYRFLQRNLPPVVVDTNKLGVNAKICLTFDDVIRGLNKLKDHLYHSLFKVCGVDIETNGLRPYGSDSKMLSIALGNFEFSIAFGLYHRQCKWSPTELKQIKAKLKEILCDASIIKVAHNLSFELEWLGHDPDFGWDIMTKNWEDTMCSSYNLGYSGSSKKKSSDEDDSTIDSVYPGLMSLDNLTMVFFGYYLKSLSNVNRAKLEWEDLRDVLKYNALDAIATADLLLKMHSELEYYGLMDLYKKQVQSIPSLVLTQLKGLNYDRNAAQGLSDHFTKKVEYVVGSILKHSQVNDYKARAGQFLPTSPQDVALFFDNLGYNVKKVVPGKNGQASTEKLSSDEKILSGIDHPIARQVLVMRECTKLLSTYIEPFLSTKDSIVYPDNKVHPQFTSLFTATGRLSCKNPNIQNYPRKQNSEIRSIIVPPEGFLFISSDYGQIEYRCLVMASRDPKLIQALWNNEDVHKLWTIRIAKKYPDFVGGDVGVLNDPKELKKYRDKVKNSWVFSGFYGSSPMRRAADMELPLEVAIDLDKDFWNEYKGVKAWQESMHKFYDQNGYIMTIAGRRLNMYLDHGQVINYPIQSAAASIVQDAYNRIVEYTLQTGNYDYIPILSIHDDLSFYLSNRTWKDDVEILIKIMLEHYYDFMCVPLTLEVSVGTNWHAKKEYKTFSNATWLESYMK